jgi:post-segregation antitoxin (ccd killing protein)
MAPVNVSLPTKLVGRAKKLGINVSRAAEAGLNEAIAQAETPGFRFGALKGKVAPPPLDVFEPMTVKEASAVGL